MIGKHIKNRGVKQKSALRHPVFSYSMGDTLISPIVASYLLYLAVTYTLIRTYLDKPDNGSGGKPCVLRIDFLQSKKKVFHVRYASQLGSEVFYFGIERFGRGIG